MTVTTEAPPRPPVMRAWFTRTADVDPPTFLRLLLTRATKAGYTAHELAACARFLAAQASAQACTVTPDGSVVEVAVADAPPT